jgi:hypothetical protein
MPILEQSHEYETAVQDALPLLTETSGKKHPFHP